MNLTLKMDFMNEKAINDAGVSREVYTAFWEQFLEQCEGETERVPRLRPDFCEAEWQAVGRIWVNYHLQRYVKNADQTKAEKILRFCTGSSVICVDKIMINH